MIKQFVNTCPFILIMLIVFSCKTYEPSYYSNQDVFKTHAYSLEENNTVNFSTSPKYVLKNELSKETIEFYRHRGFKPAWFENDTLNNSAKELLKKLQNAADEGLSSSLYDFSSIYAELLALKAFQSIGQHLQVNRIHIDILLTQAYLEYASDLLTGRINPESMHMLWEAHPRKKELPLYLQNALENRIISRSLENLVPTYDQYRLLRTKLNELKTLHRGKQWPQPGFFQTLHEGDSGDHVLKIKAYLKAIGDLNIPEQDYYLSPVFDELLTLAVKKFQARHGLNPDGKAGRETLREMNVTMEQRMNQIAINMERLRWLPANPGARYIFVNLPEFALRYYENDEVKLQMKIVIGELDNYTPVLKDTLQYIVFNPNWRVPYSIASEEMLPKIKKDTSFLQRNNYVLLRGSYLSKDTLNPDSVNWKEITKENFPYFIVQQPGRSNALGRVKFLFPNNQSIYLHDTPGRHLFSETKRDFSHGCIRLENPLKLAEVILNNQIDSDSIGQILNDKETVTFAVEKKIRVHFIYQTAWVDASGKLHFRDDIYGIDDRLIPKLKGLSVRKETKYVAGF